MYFYYSKLKQKNFKKEDHQEMAQEPNQSMNLAHVNSMFFRY